MSDCPLNGKTALVTGGSRGIGRAIAVALAEAGADVGINYFSQAAAAEEVAQGVRRAGRRSLLLPGDVADAAVVDGLADRVAAEWGRLDIAVTNAVFSHREPFHTMPLEQFRRTLDVTMWGAVHLLRAAARHMVAQGSGGSIVVISSPHAYLAVPRSMPYNMAKAALDQMAATAAIELAEHRIRVNVIHPGWIDTPGERKFATEEQIQQAARALPWRRLGTPAEVARGVVFLCDPASDYITGGGLRIDGGISLPWWANRGSAVPE